SSVKSGRTGKLPPGEMSIHSALAKQFHSSSRFNRLTMVETRRMFAVYRTKIQRKISLPPSSPFLKFGTI
ncbi:MAG: hypothetical protein ACLFN9_15920, partial [Desulfococcaceae bacterium]